MLMPDAFELGFGDFPKWGANSLMPALAIRMSMWSSCPSFKNVVLVVQAMSSSRELEVLPLILLAMCTSADSNNNRIQKFNSNGKFITKWDSSGTGDEQFYGLRGIAIGFSGNVYARDWGNNWVQVFSPSSNG